MCSAAYALPLAQPTEFFVKTSAFANGSTIPAQYAYCAPDGQGKSKDGGNINPDIQWSGAPEGTKSYAIVVVDPDVPAKFDDANKPGVTIAKDFPRQKFYHWVLVDIPAHINLIKEGEDSAQLIKGGKPVGQMKYGLSGPNDYAKAFGGSYGGYDGPCPPWNDARLHHYHFTVYALDVETLGLSGPPTGKVAEDAIAKHTLAKAEFVGTYSQYLPLLKD